MATFAQFALSSLGVNALGSSFRLGPTALPQVRVASAIDQMAAGVIDALTQVRLPSAKLNDSEVGSAAPFCSEEGAFFPTYSEVYGTPLHSCLCTSTAAFTTYYDAAIGYPPSLGAGAVGLAIAVCGCKDEFAARYPAEAESMDLCRVAAACPGVDLAAMTTGDFSTATPLCDGAACAAALDEVFGDDSHSKSCAVPRACRGLDPEALRAGVMDAASLEVVCGPASSSEGPACLDALLATDGCDAACAAGLRTLCPLLGDCSAAELAGGARSKSEGLCPADGTKVSRACAAAVARSAACDGGCEAEMAACVQGDGPECASDASPSGEGGAKGEVQGDAAALGGTVATSFNSLYASALEPTIAGLAVGAAVGTVFVIVSVFDRLFARPGRLSHGQS